MVRRNAPLSCALKATGDVAATIERLHGWPAQRPKTHARDVDDRRRAKRTRPRAAAPHHLCARNSELRIECRMAWMMDLEGERIVFDDQVARLQLHLVVGPEAKVVVLPFRGRVDPCALIAAEWALLCVVGDDVLAELRTDGFQPVTEVPDDRERPEDGVLTLHQVTDRDCNDDDGYCHDPDHENIHMHYASESPAK